MNFLLTPSMIFFFLLVPYVISTKKNYQVSPNIAGTYRIGQITQTLFGDPKVRESIDKELINRIQRVMHKREGNLNVSAKRKLNF